jgi:hypothetical protein
MVALHRQLARRDRFRHFVCAPDETKSDPKAQHARRVGGCTTTGKCAFGLPLLQPNGDPARIVSVIALRSNERGSDHPPNSFGNDRMDVMVLAMTWGQRQVVERNEVLMKAPSFSMHAGQCDLTVWA